MRLINALPVSFQELHYSEWHLNFFLLNRFFLFFVGFLILSDSAPCFGQEMDVEVEVITNQPVSAVFTDARGLVYARPLAEPEILLRYDGSQVVRLGSTAVSVQSPMGKTQLKSYLVGDD